VKTWKTIGLMSGSSLDGLDIAYAEFWKEQNRWQYHLMVGETVEYSEKWLQILQNIREYSKSELQSLHKQFGTLMGEYVKQFVQKHKLKPNLLASHGHTVFHNPAEGYTFQLGDGQTLAEVTKLTTVADFRSMDIGLGGQGAPLVPLGDELLFNEYKACINLGGIANISFKNNDERVAFDVCPANQLLNLLANKKGFKYDNDGNLAKQGTLLETLYEKLSEEPYYLKPFPKSMSNEYIAKNFMPMVEAASGSVEDKLHTVTIHIADQLQKATTFLPRRDEIYAAPFLHRELRNTKGEILVTGGGAYNRFLIEEFGDLTSYRIKVPSPLLIDYKEALVFALMGVLKINDEINCLASATGATTNCSAGVIFQG